MTIEQENITEAPESTGEIETAAESKDASYVTQDHLQSFQKSMLGEMRKVMAGMMKSKPSSPASAKPVQSKPSKNDEAPSEDVRDILRKERQVMKAIHRAGFTDEQEDIVRQMIDSSGSDDIDGFVSELALKFGVAKAGSSKSQEQPSANPNPSSNGGKPKMTLSEDNEDAPAWEWSEERLARLMKEGGANKLASEVKKNLRQALKDARFNFDTRK